MTSQFDGDVPTVACPRGHPNAWNYRFCGECGLPIGVMPYPDEAEDVEDGPRRRRGLLIGGAVAAVVVVTAVVVAVGLLLARQPMNGSPAPQSGGAHTGGMTPAHLTPSCAQAPVVKAESVDMTPEGLVVRAAFLSRCQGGSTEAGTSVRITVADKQRDIAAGLFDFSAVPMTMKPGETARRTLVFPAGMYWRTTAMFSGAPQLLFHPGERQESTTVSSGSDRLVAHAVATPEHGSIDGVAEAVLAELRDNDFSYVSDFVANRWVPQISSKKSGLTVAGKTLTSADVLRDHLDLRAKYAGVRLVSSGQWSTFSSPDWWVTIVGAPKLTPGEANSWCDTQRLGVDDCFAKFVSSLFGVEGTTVYRK